MKIIQQGGMFSAGQVSSAVGMKCVMTPAKPMSQAEAQDKYLGVSDDHLILDFGDGKKPELLVANELNNMVAYELVPELCSEGLTIEDLYRHMKAQGHNVQGISPDRKYVYVMETIIGGV